MATSEKTKANPAKFVSDQFRLSFPHLFKAQAMPGTNNAPKFSLTMLVDKETDVSKFADAIKAAKTEKWGDKSKWPKNIKSPIGDGDAEAGIDPKTGETREGYAGHWVIKASSNENSPPGVYDEDVEPIIDPKKIYSGCYCRASLFATVWEFPKNSGKFGVMFIVDHVQKVGDGESFSSRTSGENVFSPVNSGKTKKSAKAYEDEAEENDFR